MVYIQTTIRSYLLTVFHIIELIRLHEMLRKILQRNLARNIIRVFTKFYITRLYEVSLMVTLFLFGIYASFVGDENWVREEF